MYSFSINSLTSSEVSASVKSLIFWVFSLPSLTAKTFLLPCKSSASLSSLQIVSLLTSLTNILFTFLAFHKSEKNDQKKEGKSELVIAVGCTGGKHRSVTLARKIHHHLHEKGYAVTIAHRDITKQ